MNYNKKKSKYLGKFYSLNTFLCRWTKLGHCMLLLLNWQHCHHLCLTLLNQVVTILAVKLLRKSFRMQCHFFPSHRYQVKKGGGALYTVYTPVLYLREEVSCWLHGRCNNQVSNPLPNTRVCYKVKWLSIYTYQQILSFLHKERSKGSKIW